MSTNTAPQPAGDTPLYPAGDFLADADGYLSEPTGEAVVIDGKRASVEITNAEADRWVNHVWD